MEPDFQQADPALPEVFQSDKTEAGHVYASAVVLDGVAKAGKNFKETLEALDKEIERYDYFLITNTEILTPPRPDQARPNKLYPSPFSYKPTCQHNKPKHIHD